MAAPAPTTTVTLRVPAALRDRCGGASELSVSAPDVRGALRELGRRHPVLYGCICDETGAVRRHVNLFVDTSDIRHLDGLDTALSPGDVVTVLPAVSGG